MKQVLQLAKRFSLWAFAISILGLGCTDVENMFPTVTAAFTYTIDEDTGTVSFINLSEDARTYAWNFGDGTSSNEVNPFKTYSASGSYTVSLVATNSSGASDTAEDALSITIRIPASLPINFDGTNTIYNITAFDGAAFAIVEDHPAKTAKNAATSKVGELTNSGATFEGIFIDLAEDIDLTDDKTIQIEFYSEVAIDVLAKLEQGSAAAVETTASHTGSGWETLAFNYTSSASYSRLTLFADGPGVTAGTFYLDNIEQVTTAGGGGGECTAETAQSLDAADFNLTFQTDPGALIESYDAGYSYVANPDFDNAVNPSCQVGQIDRTAANLFANNQIVFDSKFDFNANSGFKLKVWAPTAGTNVLLKLEDKTDSNINTEVSAATTVANAWEELTFDFDASESGKYDRIILFFELNTNTVATYYIDDFRLYTAGGGGATCTAETEQSLSAADLNLTFQTDPGALIESYDAGYSYVANPDFDNAVNPSCQVGQIDRTAANLFANNQIAFDTKFDFNSNSGFKLKVWAPTAGTNVLLKLEDKTDSNINAEVGAVTTVANAWEELTFDFAPTESGKYDRIILFFELNTNTVATYYIDDFRLYGTGGGGGGGTTATFPLDFEDGALFFSAFEGATVGVIDNPQTTGNPSSKVLEMTKPAGVPFFAGITTDQTLNGPDIDLSNGLVFTMKIWSPKPNINVRMRLEQEPGVIDPPAYEIFQTSGAANEWVTLTFDFSTTAAQASSSYTRLVLNADWDTNPAGGETFYIDDIEQGSTGGGGGGGGGGGNTLEACAGGDLINDFETADNSIFGNFGGGVGTIIDNPDTSVNTSAKVGQYVKNADQPFGGITIAVDPDIDFNAGVFSIDVSSQAVRQLLFKLEGPGIEVIIPTSGTGWETLTYDFSSVAGNVGTVTDITLIMDNGTIGGGNGDWTILFDNIRLCSNGGTGGGGGGSGSQLAVNGDFETGDISGWTSFAAPNNGTFEATTAQSNGGAYSGLLVADVDTFGAPSFPVVKQANIGVGVVPPNTSVTITFDLFGSTAGPGGVVFAEFFSELSGGGTSSAEILGGGPLFPTNTWTTYSFTTTTGNDVSGGVTLQLKADCGGNAGCRIDAYFDNVTVTIN